MVWGVLEPSGFGQFFPHGEFENEKSFDPEADKYTLDLGPVSEAMQPRRFNIERGGRTLAAWIKSVNRLPLVADEVRAAIERVEPDVHQFWPMAVVYPNGDRTAHDYHAMVIRQFRDAVIEEKSEVRKESSPPASRPAFYHGDGTKANVKKITLSAERIGSAHLWRDQRLHSPNIFMSDALQSAIAQTGLTIMPHARTKVA